MYYVLINSSGHYLARGLGIKTTRHIQEAKWFLHKNYKPEGFKLNKLNITVKPI